MDTEFYIHAAAHQVVVKLPDFVLSLGDSEAIAGHDDYGGGRFQNLSRYFSAGAAMTTLFAFLRGHMDLAESTEQDVGERAVHGLAHDDREDEARRSVESAGDDEQVI